jgi:hypothetical protein
VSSSKSSSESGDKPNAERVLSLPSLTAGDVCPTDRLWNFPSQYYISPLGSAFNEISYMAFSTQTHLGHQVVYVASDKEQSTLYAVYFHRHETTGEYVGSHLASLEFGRSTFQYGECDWESISMGPCNNYDGDAPWCIYVGSTGNNAAHECRDRACRKGREEVQIYKVMEPTLAGISPGSRLTMQVHIIRLSYRSNFPVANNDGESTLVQAGSAS